MAIPRGYIPNHKVMGKERTTTGIGYAPKTTIMECPNCGADNNSIGDFDEDVEAQITCSKCRYTASKWTYVFIRTEGTEGNES